MVLHTPKNRKMKICGDLQSERGVPLFNSGAWAPLITGDKHMTRFYRAGLAALALFATLSASTGSASAWGCIAVSEEGSYGYSYSYNNENAATQKALNECAKHTTTESTCEITECDEDS